MAWTLPLSPSAWTPHPWQQLAVWNECIRATNMRLLTVEQTGWTGTTPLVERVEGEDLQSTLEDFRHAAFQLAVSNIASGGWVHRDALIINNALDLAGNDYIDGTGWTQLFVDEVNAKLVSWGLDEMGPNPLSGNIPWTRKHGDRTAWTTSFGTMQVGDWFGGHIFNEWRACLDVLDCIVSANFDIADGNEPDYWMYSGGAGEETSCESVKGFINDPWNAEAHPMGPPSVVIHGNLSGVTGDFQGTARTSWQPYVVGQPAVTSGTQRMFAGALAYETNTYEDFGTGWVEDVVGQIEEQTATGADFVFEIAPWVDDEFRPINYVDCPNAEGDPVNRAMQVTVQGVLVDVDYPDP